MLTDMTNATRQKAQDAVRLFRSEPSDRLKRAARAFDRATTRRERAEALVWVDEALRFEPGVSLDARKAISRELAR